MLLTPELSFYDPRWSKIHKVCLTGGPRAGKSTLLDETGNSGNNLITLAKLAGYIPFVAPEAATTILKTGIHIGEDFVPNSVFQRAVSAVGMTMEKVLLEMLLEVDKRHPGKVIAFFDRGSLIEQNAYCKTSLMKEMEGELATNNVFARDRLYDIVLHLRSSACNLEIPYDSKSNNACRQEGTREEAIAKDMATLRSYIGHPHLRIVPSFIDIYEKALLAWQYIEQMLLQREIEEKFLVDRNSFSLDNFTVDYEVIEIVQHYLKDGPRGFSERIRMRGQNGHYIYFRTMKRKIIANEYEERERQITAEKFLRHLTRADGRYYPIEKRRVCFVYNNQYFELDLFDSPTNSLCLMELELLGVGQKYTLPPFIKIIRKVTGEKEFMNRQIARRSSYPNGIPSHYSIY